MSYLERTPDVQALLASGSHIIEMRFDERRRPVERLVAVRDVKVPKKEREAGGVSRPARAKVDRDLVSRAYPLSVAEVRKLYPHALGKPR